MESTAAEPEGTVGQLKFVLAPLGVAPPAFTIPIGWSRFPHLAAMCSNLASNVLGSPLDRSLLACEKYLHDDPHVKMSADRTGHFL